MLSDPPLHRPLHADRRLQLLSRARVPVDYGAKVDAELVVFGDHPEDVTVAALVVQPDLFQVQTPMVRLHSACFTGDVFGSLRCDCGSQLEASIRRIQEHGCGVVLYLLSHEGRGIGLARKLEAYQLQDQGLDTVDANLALGFAADEREFESSAIVLRTLGVERLMLLTNNPDKAAALARGGLIVENIVHLPAAPNPHNRSYLDTKVKRLGHIGLHTTDQGTGSAG